MNLYQLNMKERKWILVVMASLFLPIIMAQDARDIAKHSSAAIEFETMEMTVTLKIYDNKGNMRQRQVSVATKKFSGVTKTMMKFLSPADVKGTAMLIYDYETKDDDMWVYLPSTRKTRRIVSSEKGKSFMGSEFSNADMSKPTIDEFNYKLTGNENYNGQTCLKLETTCKDTKIEENNGYGKKVSWIDQANYLSYKIEFYTSSGKLIKTIMYSDYRKQASGKYFSFHMVANNHLNGRKSEMVVDKFILGSKLPEANFTTEYLEK
jgi:outer membrane lipoprotein-sorting protein